MNPTVDELAGMPLDAFLAMRRAHQPGDSMWPSIHDATLERIRRSRSMGFGRFAAELTADHYEPALNQNLIDAGFTVEISEAAAADELAAARAVMRHWREESVYPGGGGVYRTDHYARYLPWLGIVVHTREAPIGSVARAFGHGPIVLHRWLARPASED